MQGRRATTRTTKLKQAGSGASCSAYRHVINPRDKRSAAYTKEINLTFAINNSLYQGGVDI